MHPWLLFIDLLIFAWPIASHIKREKLNMCSAHICGLCGMCAMCTLCTLYTRVHSRSIESIFNTKSNECLKGQTHTLQRINLFSIYLSCENVCEIFLSFPATSLDSTEIKWNCWFIYIYSKLASIIEFLFHLKCFTTWVSVLTNTSTKCLLFVFDLLPPTKTIFLLVRISEIHKSPHY